MKKIKIDDKEISISDESYEAFKDQFKTELEGRWKPELGEAYYFVDDGGVVLITHNVGSKWRYSQRNCFKTKKEAEDYRDYLKAVAKIRDSATLVPDWDDMSQDKHFVVFSFLRRDLDYVVYNNFQLYGHAYYSTVTEAEKAIKDLKEEFDLVFKYEREVLSKI